MGRVHRQSAVVGRGLGIGTLTIRASILRTILTRAALFTALLAGAGVVVAQEPIYRVDVRLVRLLVTVKNAAGDLIGSLDRRLFNLTDNGVPQEIAVFERETAQPLSVTLLVDTSGSTGKDLKYETTSINKFLGAFIEEGNPQDAVALYTFNWQVTLLNSFTRRIRRIEDNLKVLRSEGGTSLYDAVYLAAPDLRNRQGRHVIVVVTDGGDTTSAKSYRDAVESTQRADAVVYAIVVVPITNPAGRNTGGEHALEAMIDATGGRMFYPAVGAELDRAFVDILRDLRTQYLIGYYPRGVPQGDRNFHTVHVGLGQRDLRVSTRTGYYGDSR
jgi:Ca-activated chloride channel family protein